MPTARFTKDAPGFEGKRVIDDKGDKGDANDAVIKALVEAGALIARGRLKHQYPHSWRSKKPVIFRNTPQWFIAMDKPRARACPRAATRRLRSSRSKAIGETEWVPPSGENRIRGMVEGRPDWVISRQRAWGVPITVFQHKETGEVIPSAKFAKSDELMARIRTRHDREGRRRLVRGRRARALPRRPRRRPRRVGAGDRHPRRVVRLRLHARLHAGGPARHFPGLAGIKRQRDGGEDRVMYLEGSDQHRGWFQSSLLESCGTRGRAPFDVVLTHGFILDEKGEEKMSKSKGNALSPQDADEDLRRRHPAPVGGLLRLLERHPLRARPSCRARAESYRKLRNTLRWMLGTLAHYDAQADASRARTCRELERLMLHRLAELDATIREAYADLRLQARGRGAVAVHEHRPVGVLLRHPQGRALLRALLEHRSARRRCRRSSRSSAALRVAGAAAVLHGRGGLARALSRPRTAPCTWRLFPEVPEGVARRGAGREVGEDQARAPRRHRRAGDRAGRQEDRLVAGGGAAGVHRRRRPAGRARRRRPGRGVHHLGHRGDRRGAARGRLHAATTWPGVGVVPKPAEGTKCARSWRITKRRRRRSRRSPSCPPRDAAAVREFDARK